MVTAARTASQVTVHMSVAFLIMYAFTGSLSFGGLAAILEPICVVGILPLHDRMWRAIEARLAARANLQPGAHQIANRRANQDVGRQASRASVQT